MENPRASGGGPSTLFPRKAWGGGGGGGGGGGKGGESTCACVCACVCSVCACEAFFDPTYNSHGLHKAIILLLSPKESGRLPHWWALKASLQYGGHSRTQPLIGRFHSQILGRLQPRCGLQPGAACLRCRGDSLPHNLLLREKFVLCQSLLQLLKEQLEDWVTKEQSTPCLDPHSHMLGNAESEKPTVTAPPTSDTLNTPLKINTPQHLLAFSVICISKSMSIWHRPIGDR